MATLRSVRSASVLFFFLFRYWPLEVKDFLGDRRASISKFDTQVLPCLYLFWVVKVAEPVAICDGFARSTMELSFDITHPISTICHSIFPFQSMGTATGMPTQTAGPSSMVWLRREQWAAM